MPVTRVCPCPLLRPPGNNRIWLRWFPLPYIRQQRVRELRTSPTLLLWPCEQRPPRDRRVRDPPPTLWLSTSHQRDSRRRTAGSRRQTLRSRSCATTSIRPRGIQDHRDGKDLWREMLSVTKTSVPLGDRKIRALVGPGSSIGRYSP